MTAPRTTTKPARELLIGDRMVTSIPGRAVYFDTLTAVERLDDGRVRVQVKGYGGWTFFLSDDAVRVIAITTQA